MKSPASLIPPLPLHERIHAIRFFANMNQLELAKALECSQGTVSKLENGDLEPTAFQLIRLRETFGISIDAIVDGLIPYRSIAERFSNATLIPNRYARGANSKLKFLYPLIHAFEARYGISAFKTFLQHAGIKQSLLAEPEILLNGIFYEELTQHYLRDGKVSENEFLSDIKDSTEDLSNVLTTGSVQPDEWFKPEKWNLSRSAIHYSEAVISGLKVGAPNSITHRRMRA